MSAPLHLLTLPDAIGAAAAARARVDKPPLDPRRALDGLSSTAIVSIAIALGQLDAIARAAARAEDSWRRAHAGEIEGPVAAGASDDLIRLLKAAGYLPFPVIAAPEEPARG